MAAILHFLLALVVIFALALLVSHDRKQIRLRFIVQLIVVEAALGWFFLHSAGGKKKPALRGQNPCYFRLWLHLWGGAVEGV